MHKKLHLLAILPAVLLSSCGSSGFKADTEANVKKIASSYDIKKVEEKYNEFSTIDITYKVNKAEGDVLSNLADCFIDVFVMLEPFKPDKNFKVNEEVKSIKREFSYNGNYISNSRNVLMSSLITSFDRFGVLNNNQYFSNENKIGVKGDINIETAGVQLNVDVENFTLEMYSNEDGLIDNAKFEIEIKDDANTLSAYSTHKFNWKLKI